MVCRACPDLTADLSVHCAHCDQHLHPTRFPDRWFGVLCRVDCGRSPTGIHVPGGEA